MVERTEWTGRLFERLHDAHEQPLGRTVTEPYDAQPGKAMAG